MDTYSDHELEKVRTKLEGLLNMTTSNGATVAEAAAAAQRAQYIATKYGIDLDKLDTSKSVYITVEFQHWMLGRELPLLQQVARLNQCRLIVIPQPHTEGAYIGYQLFGKKRNIELASYLFDAINNCLMEMAENDFVKANPRKSIWKRDHSDRTDAFYAFQYDFYRGASEVITRRLQDGKKMAVADTNSSALMVVWETELDNAYKQEYSNLRSVNLKSRRIQDWQAYTNGQQAGKSLKIYDAVES